MDQFPTIVSLHDHQTITINNTSFSIGRSLDCNHVVNNLNVSRFHCVIKKTGSKWMLIDQSSNGTLVNEKLYHCNEHVDLKDGDVIKLLAQDFEFRFRQPPRPPCEPSRAPPLDASIILVETEDDCVVDPIAEEIASLTKKRPDKAKSTDTEPDSASDAPPQSEPQTSAPAPPERHNRSLDLMENELTCSICSELFIKAVTLTCSHTFCQYCIEQWRRNKTTCPICRQQIKQIASTLVLDNFIARFLENQSEEVQKGRLELVTSREALVSSVASTSATNVNPAQAPPAQSQRVIEILDDDDDDEDDFEDASNNDSDPDYGGFDQYDTDFDEEDPDFDYTGVPGHYYGGYGRCYRCNQTGHWANGCPWR